MIGYLLDTNVISETIKPSPDAAVAAFLAETPDLWISTPSVQELFYGLERMPTGRNRQALASWIDGLKFHFDDRILPLDWDAARRAGACRALGQSEGLNGHEIDSQIAGIALHHGLTVATRNIKDFAELGVPLFNPWTDRKVGS
jgi:toxin FitB